MAISLRSYAADSMGDERHTSCVTHRMTTAAREAVAAIADTAVFDVAVQRAVRLIGDVVLLAVLMGGRVVLPDGHAALVDRQHDLVGPRKLLQHGGVKIDTRARESTLSPIVRREGLHYAVHLTAFGGGVVEIGEVVARLVEQEETTYRRHCCVA